MTLRTLPIAVLLAAPALPAQDYVTSVRDLLGHRDFERREAADQWVNRFSPMWHERDDQEGMRGFIGEVELLGIGYDEEDESERFSDDSLGEFLNTLLGTDDTISVVNGRLRAPREVGERVQSALAWLRGWGHGDVEYEFELVRIAGQDREVLASGTSVARRGRPTVFGDVGTRSVLWTFNVELAQGSTTGDPRPGEQRFGSSVALQARVFPDGKSAFVQAIARVAADPTRERIGLGQSGFGELDRVVGRAGEVATAFIAPRGERVLTQWLDEAGRTLRLSCKVSWPEPRLPKTGSVVVRADLIWSQPIIQFELERLRNLRDRDHYEPRRVNVEDRVWESFLDSEASERLSRVESGRAVGLMAFGGATAVEALADLTDRMQQCLPAVGFDVTVYELPVGANPSAGADAAAILARASGGGVADHPSCFRGAEERTYVSDWDVEVATNARIPTPEVSLVQSGYVMRTRVRVDASGRPFAVDLDCKLARLDGIDQRDVPINQAIASPSAISASGRVPPGQGARSVGISTKEVRAVALPQDIVRVESPKVRSHRIRQTVRLDQNGAALLRRRARTFCGENKELVVVVRAAPRD